MIRRVVRKIGAGWLFLIGACIVYAAVGAFNFQIALDGLQTFLRILVRILPALALVFALLFLTNLFIDSKTVARYLGRGAGQRGWLIAVIAGILSAGPIYLWYSLLSDLREKGMRDALVATFLYNRAVKIPLLPMMILYFSVKLAVILTVFMVLFSILDGVVVERILAGRRKGA